MCLDVVQKICEPNDDMVEGYKVFRDNRGGPLEPELQLYSVDYELGKAYAAEGSWALESTDGDEYPTGFHVFLSHAAAEQWCDYSSFGIGAVYRVQAWDIRARGRQLGATIYVAKNMRIMGPA